MQLLVNEPKCNTKQGNIAPLNYLARIVNQNRLTLENNK
jgi:hypothetical protein